MDLLNRAFLQLADLYRSMTPGSRATAGLLIVVVAVCLGYLSTHQTVLPEVDLMHGQPIAATQLPTMEAAFAKANLKGYEVRGMSIYVPRGQEADYMAALASAGALPQNFGDSQRDAVNGGTMFDFGSQRAERMQIAKQEELAHSIRQMPGIASAYVIYDVDNRPGPFKEKLITASAMVKPEGAGQLDQRLVSAIRTMVARSIAGLKPENVAVTDLSAGRTWYGDAEEATDAGQQLHISLKRSYEQDLKTKILEALCYIPNVTVVTNVEISPDRNAKIEQPVSAKVSVGVPMSYFHEIRRRQNPTAAEMSRDDAAAEMERIRNEETAKIQKHVAQLLPVVEGVGPAMDRVAVTTFQDIRADENPSTPQDAMLDWAKQSWRTLVAVGLGLVCLLVLWSVVRLRPAAVDGEKADETTAAERPSVVPAPHAQSFYSPSDSIREDISELVKENPDAAANILRSWIGQVN